MEKFDRGAGYIGSDDHLDYIDRQIARTRQQGGMSLSAAYSDTREAEFRKYETTSELAKDLEDIEYQLDSLSSLDLTPEEQKLADSLTKTYNQLLDLMDPLKQQLKVQKDMNNILSGVNRILSGHIRGKQAPVAPTPLKEQPSIEVSTFEEENSADPEKKDA